MCDSTPPRRCPTSPASRSGCRPRCPWCGDRRRDRVAVITGSGSGVGRAAALEFARHGARVAVADLRDDWGNDTVALVDKAGGEAEFVHCDATDERDVDALVAAAVERFGRLDVMYNNVGIATPNRVPFHEQPIADIDRLVAVNLRSMLLGCRAAVRQ